MNWKIKPATLRKTTISVPGDKSISHRLAIMATIAEGVTRVSGFLDSDDCVNTLRATEIMGAKVRREGDYVEIEGTAGDIRAPEGPIDCGNSGTAMRLLPGFIAGFPVSARLIGDESLHARPMRRIIEPLSLMGADIAAEGEDGRPPLRIKGGPLSAIEYRLPVASAQVKSCILLAGLMARGTTRIIEPAPSRDHTERLFKALGIPVEKNGATISVRGAGGEPPRIPARDWSVPGDISSAAFWMVAAAVSPGSRLTLRNIGLNPSRTALLDVLRRMGADIRSGELRHPDWEPQADLAVHGAAALEGLEIGGEIIPNLIDEIPIICVAAAMARGATRIRDAAELRVKESDRIESTAALLRAAGVKVQTFADGLEVQGGAPIRGFEVDSHGDHRIAMAAAVLAMAARGESLILNTECVGASYPEFARTLENIAPGAIIIE